MRAWDADEPSAPIKEVSMSHPLLEYIHSRFREQFGDPNTTLARDSQWSLRGHSDPRAPSIFVLVNGSHEKPAAWIFDPYDAIDGVWKSSISAEADVDRAVEEVRRRLAVAAKRHPDGKAWEGAAV
jgi:hypothetical protein